MRLAEAQQLYDAMSDPLLIPALKEFFDSLASEGKQTLLVYIRQSVRDTHKESRIAGKIEAYEEALADLTRFAREQLEKAAQ